jgi:uncharacterized protein YgiM (DUF1202 family)
MTPALRYLLSLGGLLAVTGLSVMALLDVSAAKLADEPQSVVAVQRVAEVAPAPAATRVLTPSDFDIARSVPVRITGRAPDVLPGPVASLDATAAAVTDRATVTADAVNVRAAASVRAERVGVVRAGTEVEVLGEERSWSRVVAADGTTGWMASKFLSRSR